MTSKVVESQKKAVLVLAISLLIAAVGANAVLATPEGVTNITILASQQKSPQGGVAIAAQGGNITSLNIASVTQSKAWQGFVGNISANLSLSDAAGSKMYMWNVTNISGELYASRNSSINWNNIYVVNNCDVDEILTGQGSDRVSKTFDPSANTVNFSVGTIAINSSTACAALPNVNNTKQKQLGSNLFENVILSPQQGTLQNITIYTGILQDQFVHGYDSQDYNFQLLVPVNKTSGFTTYYIYAELE